MCIGKFLNEQHKQMKYTFKETHYEPDSQQQLSVKHFTWQRITHVRVVHFTNMSINIRTDICLAYTNYIFFALIQSLGSAWARGDWQVS